MTTRTVGRPPIGPRTEVYLTAETYERVAEAGAAMGESTRGATLRRLIEAGLDAWHVPGKAWCKNCKRQRQELERLRTYVASLEEVIEDYEQGSE